MNTADLGNLMTIERILFMSIIVGGFLLLLVGVINSFQFKKKLKTINEKYDSSSQLVATKMVDAHYEQNLLLKQIYQEQLDVINIERERDGLLPISTLEELNQPQTQTQP